MNTSTTTSPASPTVQREREAYYGRADTQSLAPLWTRLKSPYFPQLIVLNLAQT